MTVPLRDHLPYLSSPRNGHRAHNLVIALRLDHVRQLASSHRRLTLVVIERRDPEIKLALLLTVKVVLVQARHLRDVFLMI